MTTEKKIQIINGLIERVQKSTYESSSDIPNCKEGIKSFIRKTMPNDTYWIGEVDSISWTPVAWFSGMPDHHNSDAWNSGKSSFLKVLTALKEELKTYEDEEITNDLVDKKCSNSGKIFIVHGHDDGLKNEVARFIAQLELEPIILHEQASSGATIIEKIEQQTEVGFGIVLYTACDVGNVREKQDELNLRARQNVIFEHGYLIGKLGRQNVTAIVKGDIEKPSDVAGVMYTHYSNGDSWKIEIIRELKSAGYNIDANKLYI